MKKQKTNWVTIKDNSVSTEKIQKTPELSDTKSPVKNKLFWGAGFVAVVVFALVLVAPQQLASVLKGDLFDGTGLSIIPTEESAEQENAQDIESDLKEAASDESDQQVVEAQTDAVAIQVEPLVIEDESDSDIIDEDLASEDEKVLSDITSQLSDINDEEVSNSENEELKEELDENKKLLETLVKEVAEFKNKESEYKKELDLMHASAENLPAVTTTATIGANTQKSGYRVNTHTVQVSPEQALQQNTFVYNNAVTQRTLATAPVASKNYQAQLLNATSTPESGPRETLLISFLLTFISMLGWKLVKTFKA